VRGKDMPAIEFLDTLRDSIDVFPNLIRISVAAHQPYYVVEIAISLANIPPQLRDFSGPFAAASTTKPSSVPIYPR